MNFRMKCRMIPLLVILFLFTSCWTAQYAFETFQPSDDISAVSIVEISSESEVILTEEVQPNQILEDISALAHYQYLNDPCQTLNGRAIKISYHDGSCEFITWECQAYEKEGQYTYRRGYFDKKEFSSLIEQYTQ